MAIRAGVLAWNAARQSPTYDEAFHLAAIPALCARPRVNWQSVPDTFQCGQDFQTVNGARFFWLITLGRWVCIPFSLIGGCVCYLWARKWHGDAAGMIALLLWYFCPNMMAYGQVITGDMAATSLGLLAGWFLLGCSLWATFRSVGVENPGLLAALGDYQAAVALATVAGFLSMIPAGLGVRDVILVSLLVMSFPVPEGIAVVTACLLELSGC